MLSLLFSDMKTRRSAHQTSLGESSHAQGLASHSQEGGLQTQTGASASQSAHVHSQASASQAGASVSQAVHSQQGASQAGGLRTPRSLPDAPNISEHATISPQTPGSASSVASVGTTRRGRGPSRVTSVRILPLGQTISIDLQGGSSVGPYAQQFTTYLGVCNRVHCNLWQQNYMTLPPEKKEAILRNLQQHFNFLRSPAIDADILRHMGEMQRKQRSHLKRKDDHLRMHVIICHQVMILVNGGTCVRYGIEKIDQMTQLMNPTPSEESDATANPPVLTPEEAFRQRLLEEQSQQKSKISQQKSEISQQKSEIERMKKIIEDQEQRIAAQSTYIDVRVEAQVETRLAELKTQMLQSMDDRLQELIRIRMSESGAPAMLPEDETEGEEGDGEDEGTFGEDE
ncbi:hypothetical protein Taro_020016 [Colocasia esculenta]|uniref:Uncharacterized protein n=1 Tax=Colocasia esculenta TaxID=4460 RepID=A0A843V125_COLES|nr:hypothetical protein [Colocasia esculenta]